MQRPLPFILIAAVLTSAAAAQQPSIFIDIGSSSFGSGVPSPGYGAAAPVGGQWNDVDSDLFPGVPVYTTPPLVDIAGATTPVTLTLDALGFGFAGFQFNEPSTSGDDQALIDDFIFSGGPSELRFDGLPAGSYDVITYAMAADEPTARTTVNVLGSADPLQQVGGSFAGGFVEGVTHAMHTVTVVAGVPLTVEIDVTVFSDSINGIQIFPSGTAAPIGQSYCGPAVVNSSGQPASMHALGSTLASSNDVTLMCQDMPFFAFGFFIVSSTQGFVMNPGGSTGHLCLGGSTGRYVGPGQIQNSGAGGEISLTLDLTTTPQPTGSVAIQAGETWNWQAWFRDAVGGVPTSNFSDGIQIDFL